MVTGLENLRQNVEDRFTILHLAQGLSQKTLSDGVPAGICFGSPLGDPKQAFFYYSLHPSATPHLRNASKSEWATLWHYPALLSVLARMSIYNHHGI